MAGLYLIQGYFIFVRFDIEHIWVWNDKIKKNILNSLKNKSHGVISDLKE